MRKLIFVLLIAGLIAVSTSAFAELNRFNQDQNDLICTNVNSGQSAATYTLTDVSSGALAVGHRILALTICPTDTSANSEVIVALYDLAPNSNIEDDGQLECEIEDDTGQGSVEKLFVYPYKIRNGVVVRQGAKTTLMVEYEYYPR